MSIVYKNLIKIENIYYYIKKYTIMKVINLYTLISVTFNYVIDTCKNLNIDESHGLKHSMEVFNYANKIYNNEQKKNLYLQDQQDVIYVSAIIHDMCDRKYLDEKVGLENINNYMKNYMDHDKLEVVNNIISTMSYSKTKKNGYPNLEKYQLAYHIVREADLLSGYDIDRSIIYAMMVEKLPYDEAVQRAISIFNDRILKYRKDELFVTTYSKNKSLKLHKKAITDLENLSGFL